MAGIIILNGLFGWMDILIILKWIYPLNAYSTNEAPCTDGEFNDCGPVLTLRNCPAIIGTMINNFLKQGTNDVYFISGQKPITNFCTIMVFLSVPLMLCVKPCVLGCCLKKKEGHDFERIDAGHGESHNEEADARENHVIG